MSLLITCVEYFTALPKTKIDANDNIFAIFLFRDTIQNYFEAPMFSVSWIIFIQLPRVLMTYQLGFCVSARPFLLPPLPKFSTSQSSKASLRVNGRLPLYHQYPKFQYHPNPAITDPYQLLLFSLVVLKNTLSVPIYIQHFTCRT